MGRLREIGRWACVLVLLLGNGCASTPELSPRITGLFHDAQFEPRKDAFEPASVFELSPAMRTYLRNEVLAPNNGNGRARTLLSALYDKHQLQLEYDSSYTRTARQAFEAKSGNCLSLVLMTAALAKEIGLGVHYQSVFTPENVSRNAGSLYYSDHVNLVLGQVDVDVSVVPNASDPKMVVDFLSPAETSGQRSIGISEQTVLAMYMNNRAAEEMSMKRLDEAYWWARQAIVTDPAFLASYNTLGVIYERHGDLTAAEQALRHVIGIEPANHAALSNLVRVTLKLGNAAESGLLEQRLRQIKPTPPFYYFDLGMAAMQAKDYASARDHFSMEVSRAAYNHEFHFWLAGAYIGLNEPVKARKHLQIARDNATTAADRAVYAAKLRELQPPLK